MEPQVHHTGRGTLDSGNFTQNNRRRIQVGIALRAGRRSEARRCTGVGEPSSLVILAGVFVLAFGRIHFSSHWGGAMSPYMTNPAKAHRRKMRGVVFS